MKISVCVHLYYCEMWDDIERYLNNITLPYDLYVSLPITFENNLPIDLKWEEYYDLYDDLKSKLKKNQSVALQHWVKYGKKENRFYKKEHFFVSEKIKNFKSDAQIVMTRNIGMDIGGFLQIYDKINKNCDLILKIHTKASLGSNDKPSNELNRLGYIKAQKFGYNWFTDLMNGVLGDKLKFERIIEEFKNNSKCGMVGYRLYNNYKKNGKHINELIKFFNLKIEPEVSFFVGGTIFWIENNCLKESLTKEKIDYILNLFENGYSYEPSYAHAMERIFGYFVYNQKKEIVIID